MTTLVRFVASGQRQRVGSRTTKIMRAPGLCPVALETPMVVELQLYAATARWRPDVALDQGTTGSARRGCTRRLVTGLLQAGPGARERSEGQRR
jgi:hypothetical protein